MLDPRIGLPNREGFYDTCLGRHKAEQCDVSIIVGSKNLDARLFFSYININIAILEMQVEMDGP